MPTLVIVRGLPGSGKSTYIRTNYPGATPASMAPEGWSPLVVSGDHFFTDWSTGEYHFDPTKLGEAHARTQCQAIEAMARGTETVIVDNSHTRRWEWAMFERLAQAFGYKVEVVDLFDAGMTDAELAARNVHEVPEEVIATMRGRWEK